MTAPKERFWAKVLFKEFIRHYRKLNDQQIVEDVKQSMDDLDDLNETGDSFGAKMVQWSTERKNQYPNAVENGKKGGRPPTIPKTSKPPRDIQEVYDFAEDNGIDGYFARNWYARNYEERPGVDKYGEQIKNWKGALINDWKANGEKHNEEPNPF